MNDKNHIYLTAAMVSERFPGLTPRWLARQKGVRRGPPVIVVGRTRLYRLTDIERFLAECTVHPSPVPAK